MKNWVEEVANHRYEEYAAELMEVADWMTDNRSNSDLIQEHLT